MVFNLNLIETNCCETNSETNKIFSEIYQCWQRPVPCRVLLHLWILKSGHCALHSGQKLSDCAQWAKAIPKSQIFSKKLRGEFNSNTSWIMGTVGHRILSYQVYFMQNDSSASVVKRIQNISCFPVKCILTNIWENVLHFSVHKKMCPFPFSTCWSLTNILTAV